MTLTTHAANVEPESTSSCDRQLDPAVVRQTYARFVTLALAAERPTVVAPADQRLFEAINHHYVKMFSRPLVYQELAAELLRTGRPRHEGLLRATDEYLSDLNERTARAKAHHAEYVTYQRYLTLVGRQMRPYESITAEEKEFVRGIDDIYRTLWGEAPRWKLYYDIREPVGTLMDAVRLHLGKTAAPRVHR